MNYQQKYYKYKEKYINLQNILNKIGGKMEKNIKPYIIFSDKMLQKIDKYWLVEKILRICAKNKSNRLIYYRYGFWSW